jgi:hypothetical protein
MGPMGVEHCLNLSMTYVRGSPWMIVLQQLAAEASQYLPTSGMGSASLVPWLMWHAYKPLRSTPMTCVVTCHVLLVLEAAEGIPTKSTF